MNTVSLARNAMRTRFELLLRSERLAPPDLRAAGQEAIEEIARVESWLSAFRPDSDLYRINARAAESPVRVDARVFSLLSHACRLSETTAGAFDMTVGPLLQIWNLTREAGDASPTEEEITTTLASVGMAAHVQLNGHAQTVAFNRAGVRLDPGAIGKGYALDRAAGILRDAGIEHALLHGGTSTVIAIGCAPDRGDGWPVAIQHPTRADAHLETILLRDCSLSVSAVHGKTFYAADGRRFGHVIDPRSGQPVETTPLSAVVASSATDTDALSTALLVLGTPGLPDLTQSFPEAGFLVCEREPVNRNGGGNERPGLRVYTHGRPWTSHSGEWKEHP